MKKAKVWKWIAATGTSLLFLFTFIFSMVGGLFSFKNDGEEEFSQPITAQADYATLNANYDALFHASTYYYSDVTKVAGYHNGTAGYDSDVGTQKVDRNATHGSAANPFVINSEKQWNYFAGDANAKNGNYVFVLGSDLDFNGKSGTEAFKPVPSLGAKFYGANHVISNITYNFGNATAGSGLFNLTTATAIVTDVSLKNCTFQNIQSYGGFFVGKSLCSVLNCHVDGCKITGIATSNCGIGGIIGNVEGNTARVYVYRCSVFADFNINTGAHGGMGGICGDADAGAGLSVYDCIVINNYNFHTGTDTWMGGIFDVTNIVAGTNTIHEIENVVAYSNIKDTATNRRAEGSLFEGWGSNKVTINCKNTYTSGKLTGTRGNANAVYDLFAGLYHQPQISLCYVSASNVNWYAQTPYALGPTTGEAAGRPLDIFNYRKVTTIQWNNTAGKTQADMWANAVSGNTLPSKIWMNKNVIDNTYMTQTNVALKTGYTLENSPVRNPLKITVKYYNLKAGGSADQYAARTAGTTGENTMQPIEVRAGESLCGPEEIDELNQPNRIFRGWTTDSTGESEPFTSVPSNMLGDNMLYAMWKIDEASISIEASGTGSDFGEDEENGGYSMTYNTAGITLRATLKAEGMTNPKITHQWKKGGTAVADGGTTSYFTVANVRDSGDYSVYMKFHDANEPLFMGEIQESDAVKVTIKPAPLFCSGVKFAGGRPYSGAPYETAEPTAIVKDKDGIIVNGETKWKVVLGRFNNVDDNAENINDDKETKEITFKPSEEYEGNYGETKDFEVTFPIEYLTFTFYIPKISDLELVVKLEYGQHYTYNNVVTLFEEAFEPYLGVLAGNTPAFVVGDQTIKINDYRKMTGAGGTTTAYKNVTESYEIEVAFVPQTYTVTFDARNGGETKNPEPMEIGHGIRIPQPTDPTYGAQMFLGWFYDYTDADGKKQEGIAWNFDTDRVTHEVNLYAKWLLADRLIKLTVTPSPLIEYIAKKPVDQQYLTVKATFEGREGDAVLTQDMVLTAKQYQIIYEGGSSVLHAKADPEEKTLITFKYTYNGTTVQAELEVLVEKILLDTSVLKQYFKDTAVVKTGGPQKMKEIDPMRISQLLPEIAGCEVTYKYYNSQEKEITDLTQVANVGTYYVRAYFTPDDTDYDAPYIQAVFQIVNEKIKLTIEWGKTEFTFNGKEQMPTPTFKDELGDPINANYTVKITRIGNTSVEVEPIKARTDYMITITLEDLAYEIDGDDNKAFAIMPATLKMPEQIKNFPYVGAEYDLNALSASECEVYFDGFDLDMMRVNAGEGIRGDKGTDAGRYNATLILLDPDSSKFEDGTTRTTMTWQIDKAKLTVEWSSYEFYESGGIQIPRVQTLYEFYGNDGKTVDLTKDIEYMGDITAMTSGEYTITVIIKPEASWISNYELDKSKTCTFVILPRAGMEAISIEWDSKTLFEYNGNVQRPGFRIKNRVGAYIDDIEAGEFRFNEESQNSRWAGDYTMTVTLRPGSNYFLTGKTSCMYTIVINSNGEGNKPSDTVTTPEPPIGGNENPGNTGDPSSGDTVQLPLWQLIVTGLSAVLFVVCAAKALGEYGKLKAAKREAKELASVSYAVTYGFAPIPLLAEIAFLGMGESTWTIIAFVSLGVFLVSLAAMMALGKKRKAAELVVRREQARIDEEKEYMRQEEQRRRDDELKMMFAAMQQGGGYQQPAFGYEDMQNMIAASMQALLPAVSQMAALPPAQSDPNAYADPYAQPQYNAPAPPQYGAPAANSETEALRAQMAEQQARMEAQMAQQQALINQLLQNQQAQAAPADYDEDLHDEALWQDNDEVVSLEESYGKLSDEAKRCYYDIGSYIMAKPKVAQNDGKYAVLFKYRGKTLFKLCIKGDAPVLTYMTDSGAKDSVRIVDTSSLNAAKGIIDMSVMKRDKELS